MTVFGVCLLTTSMVLKSILQTQISKTSASLFFSMLMSITILISSVKFEIQIGGDDAGSCTAALFLKPFAEGIESKDGGDPTLKWAHIDIAGTKEVYLFIICIFSSKLSPIHSCT